MDTLSRDIRYAVRSLRRTPGFTTVVVLILTLGIGMSTAMFTVFKTVLVDRLPIADQDRVVIMHPLDRSGRHMDVPQGYLPEIARDSSLIREVAGAYHLVAPQPFVDGSAIVVLNFAGISANYFDVLGVRPELGRLLRPEDGQLGAPVTMVLSYAAWRSKFGGDPSIVGKSLAIPSLPDRVRIVGVTPAGFDYPSGAEAWRVIPPDAAQAQVDIIARLTPHTTMGATRDAVFALTQLRNPFTGGPSLPSDSRKFEISNVTVQSFADTVLGASRSPVVALTISVALLLLIACVNIANLSLVRLLGRQREIAVRRAIGASSLDVVRMFAAETVILAVVGGALGLAAALAALQVVRIAAPPQVPRIDALGSLAAPLAAAAGITVFALFVFGVLPSVVASRVQSYAVLRSDSRSGMEGRSSRRARQWLVAMQIALAVVMLNGAGLVVRTLARLDTVDLGYRSDHLSIISFTATKDALPNAVASDEAGKELIDRIEAIPGVVSATPIVAEPFIGESLFILKVARAEQPAADRDQSPFVPFEFAGADYFRTLAIPILRGRGFTTSDTKGSEPVVVVNETLANQLWPNENAVGKRLVQVTGHTDSAVTVVGVASDTHFRELKHVGPVAYFAWEQIDNGFPGLVAVRTTRPLSALVPLIRAASHDVNPAIVLWKAQTMDQLLSAPLAQPRLSALLLSGFSIVALLLSAIGLYGVMAAGVRRQAHEIGVRMALGAMPSMIRRLVLSQVAWLVAVGLIAGLAGAIGVSSLLQSLLFQVSPIDPVTLGGVCVLLLAVAMLAGYLPARRAASIDPMEALRSE